MTEDHNEQTPAEPGDAAEGVTPGAGATAQPPETTGAVPMPAATPPPSESLPLPEQPAQPATPPQGIAGAESTPPEGTDVPGPGNTPPQGTYAMGALAGNPAPGGEPGAPGAPGGGVPSSEVPYSEVPYGGVPYGGVPYGGAPYGGAQYGGAQYGGPYGTGWDPGGPAWSMPPAPASSGRTHNVRNGVLAGLAALAVLAAGVGIGHAAWTSGQSTQAFSPSSNTGRLPSGTGNGSSKYPFPGFFGNGNSGNSGNSGTSGGSGPSDVNAIAAKVDPGLVDINTTLGYQQYQAAGTGIVLTSDGVVLTNNHVIDGATTISVTDVGNHKTYSASVVGYDRTKDIAVLQLHNASGLQTATLGNSSNVSVGEDVVGIGNAGGTGGTPSAAGGTVTALNQSITASDQADGSSEQLVGLIQTNANIQAGDSGGPLVDTSGQVLGIDTAASAGFQFQSSGTNQGYAIPINTALSIARAIRAGNGSSTIHIGPTAFLGVEISPSGSSSGSGEGNPFGNNPFGGFFGNSGNTGNSGSSVSGAYVAGTVTNGPAQEAGLAQGDVITSLGGQTISSANDLTNAILRHHPGDKVSVGWTDSNGQSHTATLQLSSGPPQ